MIRTALVLAFLVPYGLVACPLALGFSIASGSVAPLYGFSTFGLRCAFAIAGIRVEVGGREKLADIRNSVLAANHLSHLDPPAIYLGLGVRLVALAKREVFDIPLFSTILRRAGFLSIQRGDRQDASDAVTKMTESLRNGACVMVFPEGTRSHTGELGVFKKGTFVAAIEAKSRVFPVAVEGTRELMPRNGYALRPGLVRVTILDPADAGRYSYAERDGLVAEVRGRIAAALAAGRGGSGGEREPRMSTQGEESR
jgi:1-acyl-sn-glycerol-3-phosphate acyltransferase